MTVNKEKDSKNEYMFWTDQIAHNTIKRKRYRYIDKPMEKFEKFTVKTSASISGVLHIGRLSDTIRGEAVTRSLLDQGVKAEIIWVAEDMDPLRKVPKGVPESYAEYIGMPVTDIPDPWGCHKSYAEHHTNKYFEVIDDFIDLPMKRFSMREEYKKGNFTPYIKLMLENMEKLRDIQNKYRTNPLPNDWAPWTPICENCGKIITPRLVKFEDGKVHYKCNDYQFEKYLAKGCGHEGVDDPMKANGKMMWKSEWAAQWARWKIVSEGAGKEYQVPGSAFWINAEICEHILGFPMPEPIFYEHLIINGKKMSASLGNVVYPNQWIKYSRPELLRLLFLKDPMRERDFRWDILPNMMDEFDDLEKVYYGIKEGKTDRETYNQKRLFEMISVHKTPADYTPRVSFSTMIELAKNMPEKNGLDFILAQVKRLGLVEDVNGKTKELIEHRLALVKEYIKEFYKEDVKTPAEISELDKEVIKEVITAIEQNDDADSLQNGIFEVAKKRDIRPKDFFKIVYRAMLGTERGPRLGPYIVDVGKEEIIKKLKDSI